jgi:WD40 repeat protein
MNCPSLVILCGVILLTGLLVPAASAVDPLWTHTAATSGELSCIKVSSDGSTIVAGGDQLIALSREGRKLWTGWSGSQIVVSRDGNYILTSRDQTVRLISGTGTMLWDQSVGVPVTDMDMTPDAFIIAAAGGSRVRLFNTSGDGIRINTTFTVNHLRFFPDGYEMVFTTKNGVQRSNITLLSEWMDTNVTQDLLEVTGDGTSFVTVTNNRVRMYEANGSLQWDRALPGGNALGFAYSRDGSTIVVGRDDNTLQVLDHEGTVLWTARATHWITSVAVSDDGNTIVAGSMDKTVSVYDRAGTKLGSFTAQNPIRARSVAVSADGSVIAAVDASAVYGFSRSQFTRPVTPPEATTAPPAPVTTPVSAVSSATLPSAPFPTRTETPQAAGSPAALLTALCLLLISRSGKS